MNRYTIINKIEREKELSLKLVDKVRDIIEGKQINSEYLPVDMTSFGFEYLYTAKFDELRIKQLELKYKNIHKIYRKIFQSYFEVVDYSYEGELTYRTKNISEKDKIVAMDKLLFLEAINKEFLECLSLLAKDKSLLLETSCFEIAS